MSGCSHTGSRKLSSNGSFSLTLTSTSYSRSNVSHGSFAKFPKKEAKMQHFLWLHFITLSYSNLSSGEIFLLRKINLTYNLEVISTSVDTFFTFWNLETHQCFQHPVLQSLALPTFPTIIAMGFWKCLEKSCCCLFQVQCLPVQLWWHS